MNSDTEGAATTDAPPRVVAFYLPQFHAIPENDAWWGEGFTEWTNVTRARSLFPGHRQPRVPGDLGYYDLNADEVPARQAELARAHGIEGFCYYYYYFGVGKRLLEMPVDRLLRPGAPDFPFCLCWANENWTRAWDGGQNEILMRQEYGPADIEGFARSVIPFFEDPRYLRIGDKPLLVIYNTRAIPDTRETLERLRQIWRDEAGLEVHLTAALTFGESSPLQLGADSAVEFPPHNVSNIDVDPASVGLGDDFQGKVWDYHAHVIDTITAPDRPFPCFPTVVTDWDNTPRRGDRGSLFINSDPVAYHQWLAASIRRSRRCHPADSRFVFVNAWNEWAEGTYLEPDTDRGLTYLRATRAAVQGESFPASLLDRALGGEPLLPEESRLLRQSFARYPEVFSDSASLLDSWFAGYRDRQRRMSEKIEVLQRKLTEHRAKVKRERAKKEKLLEKVNAEKERLRRLEGSVAIRALKPLVRIEKGLRNLFGKPDEAPPTAVDSPPGGDVNRPWPQSTAPADSRVPAPRRDLDWTSEVTLRFPNTSVRLAAVDEELRRLESTPESFVLGKSREMVERLIGWLDELRPSRIVDIGVFKGGSAVLLNEYCTPAKLVAIERNALPCEPLDRYLETGGFGESVRIHYGVDQSDLETLEELYEDDFGAHCLDLVIDDASHFLFETRESFRFYFPRLRPGGFYIIEDWGWAHWPEDHWQKEKGGDYFARKDPLSNLVLEVMLLAASAPDLVESVWLDRGQVLIRRGPREIESPFRPETLVLNRGLDVPVIPGFDRGQER